MNITEYNIASHLHSVFAYSRSAVIWITLSIIFAAFYGCTATSRAPVIERAPETLQALSSVKKPAAKEPDWRPEAYVVQKGDTLYSIALEHGLDYRELAEWNNISDHNVIMIGRRLKLQGTQQAQADGVKITPLKPVPEVQPTTDNGGMLKTQPKAIKQPYSEQALAAAETPTVAVEKPQTPEKPPVVETKEAAAAADDDDQLGWIWPVNGKILSGFSENQNAKGMDIAGKLGQAVLAAAPGKVVYSGTGLRGYGKLIIIKHNKTYLSAYAHNSRILVKEGQNVAKGYKIAEMGDSDADQVKLHFEIRQLGKPVDPAKYLPNTN